MAAESGNGRVPRPNTGMGLAAALSDRKPQGNHERFFTWPALTGAGKQTLEEMAGGRHKPDQTGRMADSTRRAAQDAQDAKNFGNDGKADSGV